jgi:hypothetical protein
MLGKFFTSLAVATLLVIAGAPVFAQDKQSIEKNLPNDLYGEWCFVGPEDDPQLGTNYRLPSWADKCDKHKILSIGSDWFEADNTYCHPISRIKVKIECAPSGCGTSATFRAACTQTITNRSWTGGFEIGRYKGNLDLKGLQTSELPPPPVAAAPVPRPGVDLSLPAHLEKHNWAIDNAFNCRLPGKTYGVTLIKNDDGFFVVFRDALGNVDKEQINTEAPASSVMFSTVTVQSLHRRESEPFGTTWTYVNVNDEMIRVLKIGQLYHHLVRCN